jgi:protein-tyrosine phosphatase
MTRLLRQVVSGTNERYQLEGYDLDLTYIDSRTIAMGFPATGLESCWRNCAEVVQKFLTTRHGNQFKVYNLTQRLTEAKFFPPDKTAQFPFPDHHAPSLPLLLAILQSMHEWLHVHPHNIVVCHCLAGHGRTGTVISALHVYEGKFATPDESLSYFAQKRSAKSKGVKYPSQIRAVKDSFTHLCMCRERNLAVYAPLPAPQKVLVTVHFANIWARPRSLPYVLIVKNADYSIVWNSAWVSGRPTVFREPSLANDSAWDLNVAVQGNFTIALKKVEKKGVGEQFLWTTQNTAFMPDGLGFDITKFQIDGAQSDMNHTDFHERLELRLGFAAPSEVVSE